MSNWRETCRMLGINVPHWQAHALDYLESVGQVFCVDFGTDNAIDKAREHWRSRRKRKGKQ